MVKYSAIVVAVMAAVALQIVAQAFGPANGAVVTVTPNEAARRVDVPIGGRPFTSYIWPERVKKPVLDPIRSAKGTPVTRGWPLHPRPGERVDHPHHVGLWLTCESVNGVDFYRVGVIDGKATADRIEREFNAFAAPQTSAH